MKQQNLKISIPKPCHEDWDKMNDTEKGRFCGVCSKTVVDFTQMKTDEIIGYISKRNESVCGRVNTQVLQNSKSEIRGNYFRQLFSFLFFGVFLMLINACNRTQGKIEVNGTDKEYAEDTITTKTTNSHKDSVEHSKPKPGIFKDSTTNIRTESHKMGKVKIDPVIMGETMIVYPDSNKVNL